MSKYNNDKIIDAENVASNITSESIDLRYNYGYAVVATFTGSPTGTVLIQGSLDKVTWFTLDTLTISGTTALTAQRDAVYYGYIRAFKAAGGTGTLTLNLAHKGA